MNEFSGHIYLALNEHGEYLRHAQTIHELPTPHLRAAAIRRAQQALGLKVEFGRKLSDSNSLTWSEIRKDSDGLLSLRGCDLPLELLGCDAEAEGDMSTNTQCLLVNNERSSDCRDTYNCCSCGGNECGCRYCFDCHACENCLNDEE